jgi:hypothetical protein
MTKCAGKIHWMTITAIVGAVLMVGILMSGGDDPAGRAATFMSALARGDAKTLAESTYVEGKSQEEILKEWEKSVEDAKYYRFKFKIKGAQPTGETAQVRMGVWRNFSAGAYDENFQLELVKRDGKWKVRGNGISREMYPFLPRFD